MIRLAAAILVLLCASAQAEPARDKSETAPGLAATSNRATICGTLGGQTYTKRHRSGSVERSLHCPKGWQSDHGLPIAAGGADDVRNLSCQPPDSPGVMGWQAKDLLDVWAWRRICKAGADVAKTQALFLPPARWPLSYCQAFPNDKRCS